MFTRLRAATRGSTIRRVWHEFRKRIGVATLKAFGVALVLGVITYFLGHQGAGFTVASGVLLAILVALGSFVLLLLRAVGDLERKASDAQETATIMGQKIGVHKAIYAWVDGCERRLADKGGGLSPDARTRQELAFLEANVVNSLSPYWFYPASLIEQVKEIAAGSPGDSASTRLDRLLAHLRRNLEAGSYLV